MGLQWSYVVGVSIPQPGAGWKVEKVGDGQQWVAGTFRAHGLLNSSQRPVQPRPNPIVSMFGE